MLRSLHSHRNRPSFVERPPLSEAPVTTPTPPVIRLQVLGPVAVTGGESNSATPLLTQPRQLAVLAIWCWLVPADSTREIRWSRSYGPKRIREVGGTPSETFSTRWARRSEPMS